MSGGIVPKKKRSQSKKRIRHATRVTEKVKYWTKKINLVKNKDTGNITLGHRVDMKTGYYNGKQVMNVSSQSKDTIVDA